MIQPDRTHHLLGMATLERNVPAPRWMVRFGVHWKLPIKASNFAWVLPSYGLEAVPEPPPLMGTALIQTSVCAAVTARQRVMTTKMEHII